MKFKEVETKYSASDILLERFRAFCALRDPKSYLNVAGYDHFYDNKKDPKAFCRHRIGPDMNQLTFKRKLSPNDNYVRTEHNLDLVNASIEQVSALVQEFNYSYNFSLFKNCFVYKYDWYTLVYYICYNEEMKEIGRFIEIEMCEDYTWANESDAWDQLLVMEKFCKPLGIDASKRIDESLYELFRK